MAYIFSSDYPVGAFKPSMEMYHQVLQRYPATEVLHVAGSPIDARGAREAGLFSALLHSEPASGLQPCFVLANITMVPPVLGL